MPETIQEILSDAPAEPPVCDPLQTVILYGDGNVGKQARAFLDEAGVKVKIVLDRETRPADGYPTEPLTPVLVSIVTHPYTPIQSELQALGWKHVFPFYDYAQNFQHPHAPRNNGWFTGKLNVKEKLQLHDVSKLWDDDVSTMHYLQFVSWRYARKELHFKFAPIDCEARFFIPEIRQILREDETFVDGGAYDGRVIKAFLQHTGGRFRAIHAFEQSEATFKSLGVIANDNGHVQHYPLTLTATSAKYSSSRQTTALDALELSPSFVKLHLNGHELEALKGAERTLTRCRPIVAVSGYHSRDGLAATPLWLRDTLPDYRFLFRNHSWCGMGAVIYAIPKERG